MKGEDIKETIRKINVDNRIIEKIKQAENSEHKKTINKSEFWGILAAACWLLLTAILIFNFTNKDNDIILQNTHTTSPIKTNLAPTITKKRPTAIPTPTGTPKPTSTPTPTPTAEPFTRLNIETENLNIQMPEGVTKRENIDMVVYDGAIFISIYNDSSKLYRLYNINKTSGELKAVSPEVSNLKIGKGLVVYKKEDKYYTNSYSWNSEKLLSINTDDLIDVYIVSDLSVVYLENISGFTSYMRYMQYDINTKATSKVYEVVIHGNIIGGIPVVLPEPLYVVDNYSILINMKKDSIRIYNKETEKESGNEVHIHEHYGIGVYDKVLYFTSGSNFSLIKADFNEVDKYGYVRREKIESIQSSEGHLIVDENRVFLLNINNLKGLFMLDTLTNENYLLEHISIEADDKLYISNKQLVIFDNYDVASRTLSISLATID